MSNAEENGQKAKNVQKQQVDDNKVVSFHYRMCEVGEGGQHSEWMEESFSKQPLKYLHGFHNVIVGLEKALEGKNVGDQVNITLQPEEAYGIARPNSVKRVSKKHIRSKINSSKLAPGMIVAVRTEQGFKEVIVVKAGKFSVDIDFNHPLAGRVLYYEVEVVGIDEAASDELEHGHAHGVGGHQH